MEMMLVVTVITWVAALVMLASSPSSTSRR